MSIEDQVKRQEDRLEIYRWMTTVERQTILDIMKHARLRMKGEEVVQLDVMPPLEGEIKVDGPPDWLDEPDDDGDDSEEEWPGRRGGTADSTPRSIPQLTALNGNGAAPAAQPVKGICPKCEERPAAGEQVTFSKEGVPVSRIPKNGR
jgi:hypothetical protein